jgi:hypothetical protein
VNENVCTTIKHFGTLQRCEIRDFERRTVTAKNSFTFSGNYSLRDYWIEKINPGSLRNAACTPIINKKHDFAV